MNEPAFPTICAIFIPFLRGGLLDVCMPTHSPHSFMNYSRIIEVLERKKRRRRRKEREGEEVMGISHRFSKLRLGEDSALDRVYI